MKLIMDSQDMAFAKTLQQGLSDCYTWTLQAYFEKRY